MQGLKQLIKVRYFSETDGQLSAREYTYYSDDALKIGDVIVVPVRDTVARAEVSSVDVPESEIAAFRDKVKTIPAGSLVPAIPEAKPGDNWKEIKPLGLLFGEETEQTASQVTIQVAPQKDTAVLSLLNEVSSLLKYADMRVIATDADVKLATEDLSLVSKVRKAVEAKQKEYTEPIKWHLKEVTDAFKLLTVPLEQADKITRLKILGYRQEQERKRLEAEAINRQKQELARREAAFNGTGEITIDTTPVEVPAAPPAHIRTDVGTLGTSKVWRFEIVDMNLLPRDYLTPDMVKIGKVVRAGVNIPGVKSWQEDSLRINTR